MAAGVTRRRVWLRIATILLSLIVADARADATPMIAADLINDIIPVMTADPARAESIARGQVTLLAAIPSSRRDGRLGEAYWVVAQARMRTGDRDGASENLRIAQSLVPVGVRGRRLQAQIDLLRGVMLQSLRNFGEALPLYRRAQVGFISARDQRGQALSLIALGSLYSDSGDGRLACVIYAWRMRLALETSI